MALYPILFFVFILIFIGLFLPVRSHLILNEQKKSITFGWFFIVLGANLKAKTFELRLFSQRIVSGKLREKRKEKVKKAEREKKKRFEVLDLWKERDLLNRVLRILLQFLKDMVRRIHLDKVVVEADIATPDPALTGFIYGGLYALSVPTNFIAPNIRIKVQPDFENEIPYGRAEMALSTRLINVLGATLKMFFALPKIEIIRTFIKRR